MAFQNVNTTPATKLTSLEVGQSIIGFIVDFPPSTKQEGQTNITMVLDAELNDGFQVFAKGARVLIYTAGNIRYLIKDGKIVKGQLTRITRIEDKVVKGKKSSQYTVEQDAEQTLSDVLFNAATTTELPVSNTGSNGSKNTTNGAARPTKADLAKAALAAKRQLLEEDSNA
jgi:hypothetical protein